MVYQYSILRKKLQAGIMISLAAFILSGCAGQRQEMGEPELVMESTQEEEQGEPEPVMESTQEEEQGEPEPMMESTQEEEQEEAEADGVEEIEGTNEEGEEDKWNVDFEVIRAEYIYDEQRNEIEIYYPQLCGLEDSAKEVRINALIEEDVMQIIGEKNKEGDHTLYCIGLDYKIKFLNERIISILYTGWEGYVMRGHSALDDEAITVTIDIEEEKVITLQDVVTDFTELSDMLLADKFEHITMWEGKAGGYQVSMEYKECEDKLEDDLREKYQEWYTDGKNFVIIIEKRADYNEYAISNESVEHILDAGFLSKLE